MYCSFWSNVVVMSLLLVLVEAHPFTGLVSIITIIVMIPVIKYLLCIPAVLNAFTKGSDYGYQLPHDFRGRCKSCVQ